MTNLNERLDKHLQSIRETNNVISNQEILKMLKNPTPTLKRALNTKDSGGYPLYPVGLIGNFKEHPNDGFTDSYVVEPDNFIKYCICKASGVESGISINQAIKDIENNVKESERLYKQDLPEFNYQSYKDELSYYDDQARKEAEKLIKRGIDPKKILITGDDSGDETYNPVNFVIESEPFARACGAIELANKIKSSPYFKRAEELEDLIILL